MELISTYIETDDFNKSVEFYKNILQIEPIIYCENRWVEFECGNKIAIYNKKYDEKIIKENNYKNFNEAYISNFNKVEKDKKNNIIILNFYTDNLKKEYERNKDMRNRARLCWLASGPPFFHQVQNLQQLQEVQLKAKKEQV